MDLFNKKKVAELENQVAKLQIDSQHLEEYIKNRDNLVERLKDDISMMDDELRIVARSRYMDKYIKVEGLNGTLYGKVCSAESKEGEVTLYAEEVLEVVNNKMSIRYDEDGVEIYTTTLSHFRTIATEIKEQEYLDIHAKYSNC